MPSPGQVTTWWPLPLATSSLSWYEQFQHLINPAALDGPRGLVVLRPRDPFPIGVVSREGRSYVECVLYML
uniref:Uncharacterized protein n=1 Tax=Aegilops tauschii subsp. strangulata TaxID=200361 RepID=A0A453JJ75_AEGTS